MELGIISLRNEDLSGKQVGFLFLGEPPAVVSDVRLDEDVAFPVEQHVSQLVEECEPELVVPLTAIAQLNNSFGGGQPTSRPTGPRTRDFPYDNHRDTGAGTQRLQL